MHRLTASVRLSRALRRPRPNACLPSITFSLAANQGRIGVYAYSTSAGDSSSSSSPLAFPEDSESAPTTGSSTPETPSSPTSSTPLTGNKIPLSSIKQSVGFPDLSIPDAHLDAHDSLTFAPTKRAPFENQVIVRNDPSIFLVDDDLPLPPHIHTRLMTGNLSEAEEEALMEELEEMGYGLEDGEEAEGIESMEETEAGMEEMEEGMKDMQEDMEDMAEIEDVENMEDMKERRDKDVDPEAADDMVETDELPSRVTKTDLSHLHSGDRKVHLYTLIVRRVTQQTGKGKIHRHYVLVVLGNGDGLVGYGEGKDEDSTIAKEKAIAVAARSLDYVERFEERTVWTEIESKFGSTRIVLRPRPVGFGLRCNPQIHQILKAAGFKDVSAKVWGSRNPMMVIKTLFRMLHSGNAPLGMGNGVGGPGSRLDKGSGLRRKEAVERDRGRKLVDLTMV